MKEIFQAAILVEVLALLFFLMLRVVHYHNFKKDKTYKRAAGVMQVVLLVTLALATIF